MSLDSILDIIVPRVGEIDGMTVELNAKTKETAKQAILTDLLEIIGEDENVFSSQSGLEGLGLSEIEQDYKRKRNQLRQELRDKVRKYCD